MKPWREFGRASGATNVNGPVEFVSKIGYQSDEYVKKTFEREFVEEYGTQVDKQALFAIYPDQWNRFSVVYPDLALVIYRGWEYCYAVYTAYFQFQKHFEGKPDVFVLDSVIRGWRRAGEALRFETLNSNSWGTANLFEVLRDLDFVVSLGMLSKAFLAGIPERRDAVLWVAAAQNVLHVSQDKARDRIIRDLQSESTQNAVLEVLEKGGRRASAIPDAIENLWAALRSCEMNESLLRTVVADQAHKSQDPDFVGYRDDIIFPFPPKKRGRAKDKHNHSSHRRPRSPSVSSVLSINDRDDRDRFYDSRTSLLDTRRPGHPIPLHRDAAQITTLVRCDYQVYTVVITADLDREFEAGNLITSDFLQQHSWDDELFRIEPHVRFVHLKAGPMREEDATIDVLGKVKLHFSYCETLTTNDGNIPREEDTVAWFKIVDHIPSKTNPGTPLLLGKAWLQENGALDFENPAIGTTKSNHRLSSNNNETKVESTDIPTPNLTSAKLPSKNMRGPVPVMKPPRDLRRMYSKGAASSPSLEDPSDWTRVTSGDEEVK